MNILILTTHFDTGGITSYVWRLVKIFTKAGHRVIVVSSGGKMEEDIKAVGGEHIVLNIRTKSELSPKIYLALPKLIRLIKDKNIDVIHSQTRVTQVMGVLLGKLTGKPHVSTCHGFYKKRLSRILLPCWGDAAIAISIAVKDQLINDFGVKPKKVFLVHHGVDLTRFKPIDDVTKKNSRREFGLNDEPVIGIVARLSQEKGHEILLKAMQKIILKVPNTVLMIIGVGKLEASIKSLVENLGISASVRFYSTANHPFDTLGIFDIAVVPSLQEGLGFSVIEAQAMGLPVVASRTGGIVDLIKDGETGILVEPGNADSLSEAVVSLLTNKSKANEIAIAARQSAEEKLSLDQMSQKTMVVYESAILNKCKTI